LFALRRERLGHKQKWLLPQGVEAINPATGGFGELHRQPSGGTHKVMVGNPDDTVNPCIALPPLL